MRNLYDYIMSATDYSSLFSEVLGKLKAVTTEEEFEAIEFEKLFPTTGKRTRVDLLLNKGINRLGWSDKTGVLIKEFLGARNIGETYSIFKKLQHIKTIKELVVVFKDTDFAFSPIVPDQNNSFKIIQIKELKDIVKKALPQDSQKLSVHVETSESSRDESESMVEEIKYFTKEKRDWKEVRKDILEKLKTDISTNKTTLFLGAGVSASAKMPSWGKLLEAMLIKYCNGEAPKYLPCDLENILKACGNSYIIAARYIDYIIDSSTRAKVIQDVLYKDSESSTLIETICSLIKDKSVTQVITTNYDQLIEQKLKSLGKSPISVSRNIIIPKNSVPVYHVHGIVNDPKKPIEDNTPSAPILSEEDYHNLYSTGHHWSNIAILHALQHTTCVFVGLSMTDPNLRRLFETAVSQAVTHYVFLPRIPLYEGYYLEDERNLFHFLVQEKIMESLGIQIIWYELRSDASNSHKELEELIKQLMD